MNKTTKLTIALSCIGLLAGLTACTTPSKGAKNTIEEWVKKDISQYYDYGVALSEPQKVTFSTETVSERDLSEHDAKEVVLYKTTAFQFSYEDIVDEWLSVVWVKAGRSPSARYSQSDLEISSVNYSRMYA